MKTLRPLSSISPQTSRQRPHLQCHLHPRLQPTNHNRQLIRSFLSNALSPTPQTLTASRIISYPAKAIYSVISDVESYAQFIPYCRSSTVTKKSEPTEYDGKSYPEEAKLVVGFSNDISEEFWSRIYCSPEQLVVEAVSGASETTLNTADIKHHHARPAMDQDRTRGGDVLSHLSTRWTLRPHMYKPPPASAVDANSHHMNLNETSDTPGLMKTQVNLAIIYKFANPMYGALSQAAAPKVAEKMIEAFENRVKQVAEGPANA